jgi:hypothetical protein
LGHAPKGLLVVHSCCHFLCILIYRKLCRFNFRSQKATAELTRNFKNLFLDKAEGSLPDWLTKALNKTSELQSFAKGIQKDFEAVIQVGMSKIILPKRNIFYFGCTMFLSIQILLEQPTLLAHIGFSI